MLLTVGDQGTQVEGMGAGGQARGSRVSQCCPTRLQERRWVAGAPTAGFPDCTTHNQVSARGLIKSLAVSPIQNQRELRSDSLFLCRTAFDGGVGRTGGGGGAVSLSPT